MLLPVIGICQIKSFKNSGIDNYKYFVVETTTYKDSKKIILRVLKKAGYNVLDVNDVFPDDLEQNPNLALYISSEEACSYTCDANFYLQTSDGQTFYQSNWRGSLSSGIALKRAMKQMLSYKYKYKPQTTTNQIIETELNSELNFFSEKSIRNYFEKNGTELIEGIWEYSSSDISEYRLAIVKKDYKFEAIVLERSGKFKAGDLKATFETAATDEIVTINWIMGDKRTNKRTVGTVTSNALIEFNLNGSAL